MPKFFEMDKKSVAHHFDVKKLSLVGILVSLGIVFGDIGTSPLYVMKAIISAFDAHSSLPFDEFVEGALSCVIWTLTLQTTVKYVWIALRADNKGEGGILALYSLIKKLKKPWLYLIAIVGASALIADGVITPSLTVMSAIEGLEIYNPHTPVVLITCVILFFIFFIQQFGTHFIGKFFGPVMLLWFLLLGGLGIYHLWGNLEILKSFNPYYAYNLIMHSPSAIVIMGAVFLCTTGAEALYSDLGHCGVKNIRVSWFFVKTMLILNYLGQGAWLLEHYGKDSFVGLNPFFGIMPEWLVLPGIILATAAAIIASQALITGAFTIFSEAMSLNFWPNQQIDYPSGVKGQMYIPRVNWGLLLFCIIVVLYFQESSKMEAAYGLSITVTMFMTTVLLTFWLLRKRVHRGLVFLFIGIYAVIELGFLSANIVKFFDGGWITVIIAGSIGLSMYAWYNGRLIKNKFIKFIKLDTYLPIIKEVKQDTTIPMYAANLAFLSRSKRESEVEAKIIYSILRKQPKRAEHYFILNIINQEDPYTFKYKVEEVLEGTVFRINFLLGFKIDRRINDYFDDVLRDLMAAGKISDKSPHPSLERFDILPDLKFIIIDNTYINDRLLTVKEKMILNAYHFVKYVGSDDFKAWGVSSHNTTVESAPIFDQTIATEKIERC